MFTVTVTHRPSSRFGSDEPEPLPAPTLLYGFRTRTGRNAYTTYGGVPQVVLYHEYRHHAGPATFVTREAAERNVARLAEHGYTAEVTPA